MPVGLSRGAAVERLTAWAAKYTHIQYHVGDPGPNGTANPAVENDRLAVAWGQPSTTVAGVVTLTHSNELLMQGAAASEDYTHVSHWSAASGGDFGGSGQVTADPVTVGNNFGLPAGALIVSLPVAS